MISQNSEEVTHLTQGIRNQEVPTTTVVPSKPEACPPCHSGDHWLQHPEVTEWDWSRREMRGLPGEELIQPAATLKLVITFPKRLCTPKALNPRCNL